MNYTILGGGPSGLIASLLLKQKNIVLEQHNHPGGHAGSINEQGYTFDYGPHIMFSKNKSILDFMISTLGKNIHRSKRNNKVSFKGKFLKWPFENDLHALPQEDKFECLKHYFNNKNKKKYVNPRNLREWLLYHFGKGMCDRFLFPYNEKVWNIKVDKLSMIWADRIPLPSSDDILKSALGYQTEGYTHQLYYYYPLRGGYQALSNAWALKTRVRYNFKVNNIIKTKDKKFTVSDNQNNRIVSDYIISTIPIHELIKIYKYPIPSKVLYAVKSLIINPMLVVSLGIKSKDENKYSAIYFPEKDFLVNRISFPGVFSPNNVPADHFSIQAEITCKKNSRVWDMSDDDILDHVIKGLISRNILKNDMKISYKNIQRIPYAYVVYDRNYLEHIKLVREWFTLQGIHLLGRFSYFEYINVDGAIDRAIKLVSKLDNVPINLSSIRI